MKAGLNRKHFQKCWFQRKVLKMVVKRNDPIDSSDFRSISFYPIEVYKIYTKYTRYPLYMEIFKISYNLPQIINQQNRRVIMFNFCNQPILQIFIFLYFFLIAFYELLPLKLLCLIIFSDKDRFPEDFVYLQVNFCSPRKFIYHFS